MGQQALGRHHIRLLVIESGETVKIDKIISYYQKSPMNSRFKGDMIKIFKWFRGIKKGDVG